MRRAIAFALIILTALLLQSTVFTQVRLLGARPELMYLITIAFSILEGPREGMIVGFAGGMAQDFMLNQPKGITALTLTLLGYSMGLARQYIVSPSPFLPVTLVGIGTFCGVVFYQIVAFLFGQIDLGIGYLLKVALLSAVYCAVLTPLVFPLLRRVWEGTTPRRKVLRF